MGRWWGWVGFQVIKRLGSAPCLCATATAAVPSAPRKATCLQRSSEARRAELQQLELLAAALQASLEAQQEEVGVFCVCVCGGGGGGSLGL
jgi:hypothetical protein